MLDKNNTKRIFRYGKISNFVIFFMCLKESIAYGIIILNNLRIIIESQ